MQIDILNMIKQDCIVVIPVLWIIGRFLKEVNYLKDCYIPLILSSIGIIVCIALLGFTVSAFIQGVLISGAAVGLHQVKKQFIEKED